MQKDNSEYNWQDSGYNGFMRRTLSSLPTETSLRGIGTTRAYQPREMNLDQTQISGTLGSTLQMDRIQIKGPEAQIDFLNEEGDPSMRLGDSGN